MKRKLVTLALAGFLTYTGIYIFVYLWRSFRIPAAGEPKAVLIWHGDPFARAILVSILFLIGLVILVYRALERGRLGRIELRRDLWEWLVRESERGDEPPDRLAERAVAAYRAWMEHGVPPDGAPTDTARPRPQECLQLARDASGSAAKSAPGLERVSSLAEQ